MFQIFHKISQPFFLASKQEKVEVIEKLISQTKSKNGYYLLLVIATCIVVPGLFLNNSSIVIGGMIVAPLLLPILLLSLSITALNISVFIRSLRILLTSVCIVILLSIALAILLLHYGYSMPTLPVSEPSLFVFISFCSGIAGAFGFVKENLSSTIAGVATAVSLLPPLAQVGIALVINNNTMAIHSLQLFIANVIGIAFAALLVFVILGFKKTTEMQNDVLGENK